MCKEERKGDRERKEAPAVLAAPPTVPAHDAAPSSEPEKAAHEPEAARGASLSSSH